MVDRGTRTSGPPIRRFAALDGMRAVAALSVFVFHAAFFTGRSSAGFAHNLFAHLDVGVPIFFTISGFVLYLPFVVARDRGKAPPSARRFYVNRVWRIIPAYWLALTLVGLFFDHSVYQHGPVAALEAYFLVNTFQRSTLAIGIGPAWTLSVEMFFYALLPIYAGSMRRITRRNEGGVLRTELLGASAVAAVGFLFSISVAFFQPSWRSLASFWLPWQLPSFAAGMALAAVLAAAPPDRAGAPAERVRRVRSALALFAWPGAVLGMVLVATLLPVAVVAPWQTVGRQALFVAVGACAVVPVAWPSIPGAARALLANRPARWIGLVSYSFYLWHVPILDRIQRASGNHVWGGGFVRLLTIGFLVTLVVATVSYLVAEEGIGRRRPRIGPRPETATPERPAAALATHG